MSLKYLTIITSILVATATVQLPAYSQESTQSASPSGEVDLEVIKENVKRRIQEVVNVRGDSDIARKPVAVMGILSSIANVTLSIDTAQGVQLASTSASTTYIELPSNESIDFDELSLENYVVALGYQDDTQVLDTRRVIIENEPLSDPLTSSAYGITVPTQEEDILIQDPITNQQFSCLTSRSTTYEAIQNDLRVEVDEVDMLPLTPTMIVYETDEDDPDTQYCLSILQNSSAAAPSINVDEGTQSATVPPELQ